MPDWISLRHCKELVGLLAKLDIEYSLGGDGTPANQNSAQIGMGGLDSHGNTYIRADDFGVGGADPVTGNNIFRVDALARNTSALNTLFGSGPTDRSESIEPEVFWRRGAPPLQALRSTNPPAAPRAGRRIVRVAPRVHVRGPGSPRRTGAA